MLDLYEVQDESDDPSHFVMTPYLAIDELSAMALKLYTVLKRTGKTWKSNSRLAEECGASVNTMKKARAELVKKDYIAIQDRSHEGQTNIITIRNIWARNRAAYTVSKSDKGESKSDTPPDQNLTGGESKSDTNIDSLKQTQVDISKRPASKPADADGLTDAQKITGILSAYIQALPAPPAGNVYNNKTYRGYALEIANAGIPPEDVTTYTQHLRTQPFWRGKLVTFKYVADNIRVWVADGKPTGNVPPKPSTPQNYTRDVPQHDPEEVKRVSELNHGKKSVR